MKIHYLNAGQRAMWPRVYKIAQDATDQWVDDTYEYTIPAAVRGGRMFLIERSDATYPTIFYPIDSAHYNIIQGASGADTLRINWDPGSEWADGYIRYNTALPLTTLTSANYTAAQSETYSGPDYTLEGPVLYAMSRITGAAVDDRLDYGRFSVQDQNRAASPNELLTAATYWQDEFERRVDEWRMALPTSRY